MESVIGIAIGIFILIWAFRLEINTTKTNETLQRIEQLLEEKKEKK